MPAILRHDETTEVRRSRRGRNLDALGWLFFSAWIAIVFFIPSIPDGVGALGVGAIVLAGSFARFVFRVSISIFWMIIGAVFVAAGAGEMMGIDLPLLPFALIVCGVLLLLHQRSGRRGSHS